MFVFDQILLKLYLDNLKADGAEPKGSPTGEAVQKPSRRAAFKEGSPVEEEVQKPLPEEGNEDFLKILKDEKIKDVLTQEENGSFILDPTNDNSLGGLPPRWADYLLRGIIRLSETPDPENSKNDYREVERSVIPTTFTEKEAINYLTKLKDAEALKSLVKKDDIKGNVFFKRLFVLLTIGVKVNDTNNTYGRKNNREKAIILSSLLSQMTEKLIEIINDSSENPWSITSSNPIQSNLKPIPLIDKFIMKIEPDEPQESENKFMKWVKNLFN